MHKGPKCIQSLWDHPKKIPFVQKHKEGAICAILRENTPFLAFPEAKKGVVHCARLRKAAHWPNIFIEFGDTKRCCTFSGLELAPKSRKKLIGAISCMHKGPKCIQSLWDHPKKIPFVQKHREGAICAILRENTPFLAFPEAKKGVVHCARLRKAAHWPNNNANPSGLSEKKVYCVEKRDMCDP